MSCLSTVIIVLRSRSCPHSCASRMSRDTSAPLDAIACGFVTVDAWLVIVVDAMEVAVIELERILGIVGSENIGDGVFLLTCSVITSRAHVSMDLKWYLKDTRATSINRFSRSRSICGVVTRESSCGLRVHVNTSDNMYTLGRRRTVRIEPTESS